MAEVKVTIKELVEALEYGHSIIKEDGEIDWHGKFVVAPQRETGSGSTWERALQQKQMKPKDILWALVPPKKKGEMPEWLGVRVQTLKGPMFFNLRHPEDKKNFKHLEKLMEKKLK